MAPGVLVWTSRRDETNSVLLLDGAEALLVDPAWEPDELAGIADHLDAAGLRVTAGFATHAHHDHVLWHPRFGTAPRFASRVTAERARRARNDLVGSLGPGWPAELAELVGVVEPLDGDRLPWGTAAELVRHDAHTPGHTAIWLPDAGVLIAGDMLSDVEPPHPEDSGVSEYRAGLATLRPFVERAQLVIPGHGSVGSDALQRWSADLAALDLL